MTPTSSSLEEAFALLQALEPLAVPYCVIGALAVGMWGRPRATTDLDILIAVAEQDRPRLLTTVEQQGFLYDRAWAEANPMIRQTHLRFRRGGIPADLLLPRNAHDDSVLQRRRQQPFGTRSLSVIAPEDLILYKLRAGRPRDFEDSLRSFSTNAVSLMRSTSRPGPGESASWTNSATAARSSAGEIPDLEGSKQVSGYIKQMGA